MAGTFCLQNYPRVTLTQEPTGYQSFFLLAFCFCHRFWRLRACDCRAPVPLIDRVELNIWRKIITTGFKVLYSQRLMLIEGTTRTWWPSWCWCGNGRTRTWRPSKCVCDVYVKSEKKNEMKWIQKKKKKRQPLLSWWPMQKLKNKNLNKNMHAIDWHFDTEFLCIIFYRAVSLQEFCKFISLLKI